MWLEGLGKLKTYIKLVGFRTRYLQSCSLEPQLLRYNCMFYLFIYLFI
jgi:hypothetical protein